KMSKSAGNFITLEQLFTGNHKLLDKAYDPMAARFLILQSHYRSKIDFSNEGLQAAEKGLLRLMNSAKNLDNLPADKLGESGEFDDGLNELADQCYQRMSDDFNTAQALATLFDMSSEINAFYHQQKDLSKVSENAFENFKNVFKSFTFDILGLKPLKTQQDGKTEDLVQLLIDIRNEARQKKDFETSDKIRDELAEIGIALKDEKGGKTTFQIND
ncbi:MAG TPA: DALR domain-containing protein, partial [Balneolaceae bacterium]|nr:DALR domain-containing protein [Balneolaceae bacterium]